MELRKPSVGRLCPLTPRRTAARANRPGRAGVAGRSSQVVVMYISLLCIDRKKQMDASSLDGRCGATLAARHGLPAGQPIAATFGAMCGLEPAGQNCLRWPRLTDI